MLLSICYISNAQKAFDQVRSLIKNLQKSNVKDQQLADAREKKERAWCKREIGKAKRLLARRQHDVDSLAAHIKWIIKTRIQARKDRATRIARIKKNLALIKKFKKQRCDNNLIFVKQLKEHMQAIEVLKLLRGDIIAYFNSKKKGQRGAFIERFEEYTNLLDEEHQQIYVQLKSELSNLRPHRLDRKRETRIKTRSNKSINKQGDRLTKQKLRTKKQIGKGHIDNKRGALKRLKTPKWEKISAFNRRLRRKILGMIDGLIKHLRASRRKLTHDEIHAAEDFAIFQASTEKENEYLREKIKELTAEIISLTAQLKVSRVQLVKRKKLRNQARRALKLLVKMCNEKYAYFAKERKRRQRENAIMAGALKIFNRILSKLSARVRARASSITVSGKLSGKHAMAHRVVKSKKHVKKSLKGRQTKRRAVVF